MAAPLSRLNEYVGSEHVALASATAASTLVIDTFSRDAVSMMVASLSGSYSPVMAATSARTALARSSLTLSVLGTAPLPSARSTAAVTARWSGPPAALTA